MSDWRAELERAKAVFARGLGALDILVDRAVDDIRSLSRKVDANNDRLTKLENELPSELREKLTRFDLYIEHLDEAKREHTGKIRTIEQGQLRETTAVEREKTAVEKMKANKGVTIAVIAAAGSLLAQLVQLAWSTFGGG